MMEEKKLVPKKRFEGYIGAWKKTFIGNEAIILTGGTPNTSKKEYWEPKEIPWMSSGEINKGRLYNTDDKISNQGLENSSARWIPQFSVLIALAGQGKTRGKVSINNIQLTTNQSIAAMIPKSTLKSEFLYQNFSKRYEEIRSYSSGDGSRGGLNKKIIEDIVIFLPSENEQQKIGEFFKVLDERIANQERKISKVKALKEAYLTEMFPQEGETVPKRRFKGFQGEWEKFSLENIGNTFSGMSGKTKNDFGHGEAKFVTYVNVFNNPISDEAGLEQVILDDKQTTLKYGDILFTTSSETPDEVGMSSVWLFDKPNVYLNSFCFGFRPKIKMDQYFIGFLLRANQFRKQMKILSQGISRYNISKNKVMEIEILLPSIEEQHKIGKFFKNLDDQTRAEESKLEKLKKMKEAYLEEMFV